jgi:hypothetical protein
MGNPNTPEGLAQMKRQSPLFSADKIKTPLMVVQGANDPRVNKREADQIVIALRDRNYPIEYMVAPDEGHGFARPINNLAMIAAAEKFLAKHLGGRYQESVSPEVAKRLSEITVDPKTVVLAKKPDMNAAPATDVSGKWSLVADAGGQMLEIMMELKQTGASLTGSTVAQIGSGMIDGGKVSGNKFTATLHADVQGQPMDFAVEGTIDGTKITGSFSNPSLGNIPFSGTKNN